LDTDEIDKFNSLASSFRFIVLQVNGNQSLNVL